VCPSQRDNVTHDRWKARYNLQLAIGYRDPMADPILGRESEGSVTWPSGRALSVEMVNEGLSARGRDARGSEKALIFQHNGHWMRPPARRGRTNPDQDVADLADPEPGQFNRFANPHGHNEADPIS
jgi:hypothetical protein